MTSPYECFQNPAGEIRGANHDKLFSDSHQRALPLATRVTEPASIDLSQPISGASDVPNRVLHQQHTSHATDAANLHGSSLEHKPEANRVAGYAEQRSVEPADPGAPIKAYAHTGHSAPPENIVNKHLVRTAAGQDSSSSLANACNLPQGRVLTSSEVPSGSRHDIPNFVQFDAMQISKETIDPANKAKERGWFTWLTG